MLFMASDITKRGDNYYFRARIPTHLVSLYGRSHVSLSLRTQAPETAKVRAREHRVALDRELAALQSQTPRPDDDFRGTVLHLSDADIDSICARYRAAMLADDEIERIKGMRAELVELDVDIFESALPSLRRAYAAGDLKEVKASLSTYLKKLGLTVPRQSPAFERLARRFQPAEIEVFQSLLKRRQGVAVDAPMPVSGEPTVDDIYQCWLRQTQRDLKTARAFEQAFEAFKKVCPTPTARLLKKADAVAFRNALLASGELSASTISKHIGFLRAAFQCAVGDDLVEVNPFVGVKVVADRRTTSRKARMPFDLTELQKIFSGAVYQPGFRPRKSLGAACYWLPLLALYEGARLEELAQLVVADVIEHPDLGFYLRITAEQSTDQKVKNESSIRNVPLHPQLLALGFIEYVKGRDDSRVFPDLRRDRYGKLGTSFSTWFGKYLGTLGIDDPSRVFHSFRHSFVDVCKAKAGSIPPEVREGMIGHLSASQIEMVYGSGLYPLEPQVAAMRLVEYQGLDLGHLMPPSATTLPR